MTDLLFSGALSTVEVSAASPEDAAAGTVSVLPPEYPTIPSPISKTPKIMVVFAINLTNSNVQISCTEQYNAAVPHHNSPIVVVRLRLATLAIVGNRVAPASPQNGS